jgi:acyl-CoA synthetase (AMP-forming)/AMP-acid ligase II
MNPFKGKSYAQSLALLAEQYGAREALSFHGKRWDFSQVKQEVDRASARLASLGLKRQDKVGLWLPNRPEAIWYWLGAAQMGCVAVFFNTRLTQDEIDYQLRQSDTKVLIVPGAGGFRDFLGDTARLCPELITAQPGELRCAGFPELRHVVSLDRPQAGLKGVTDWSTPPPADLPVPAPETNIDAPALIVYSSGTTALPKGVVLTQNVWRKAYDHGPRFGLTANDRLYLVMPLFGIMANVNGVLTMWTHAAPITLDDRFEEAKTLRLIQDEGCSVIYLMPVMLEKMLRHPRFKEFDLSRVRTGTIVTNDPVVMARAMDEFGMHELYATYGMSELASVTLRSLPDDPREVRLHSHGRPMPDIEVRVADPDTNKPLPLGETGELQVRGYNVMPGYYNKPVETAAAMTPDGWFKTGDAGYQRPDGNFKFISRLKDGYKHNGFNVSTLEVEAALKRHPAVAQAAVVGIPDPTTGEIGVAFVVARENASLDPDEVAAFVRPLVANYKRPERVVVLDELPLTAGTGKVQTRQLKEIAKTMMDGNKVGT